MKSFHTMLAMLIVALMTFTLPVFSEGLLGVTYTAGGGDTDIGVLGAYQTELGIGELELGELEIDGNLKYGQGVDADAHAAYTFTLYKGVGLRPFADFVGKGTSLDTVGGNLDGGLAGNLSIGNAEVGIGVFGRSSAEFAPTKRDELLAAGVDGVTAEMLDNPALDAAGTDGLPILKPDTPLHITAYAGLEWGRFDIKARWMGEASFDSPINQYRVDVGTSYDTPFGEVGVQGNIVVQAHEGHIDGEYNVSSSWMRRW